MSVKNIKKLPLYLLLFMAVYVILLGLFFLSVKTIPRQAILPGLEASAEYYKDREMVEFLLKKVKASRLDNISDPYLLNIINYQDSSKPARSIANAMLYVGEGIGTTEAFCRAVTDLPAPDTEYLRYWHGSSALVRFMLQFTDITGIYRIFTILLALLTVILSIVLLRYRHIRLWLYTMIAFAAGSLWFSTISLEYTWCALLMLIFSILTAVLCQKGREKYLPAFLLVSGILTNFLDFLTYETVTMTVPMLLAVAICFKKDKQLKETAVLSAGSALAWLCGYGGMWAGKWIYAAAVLRKNVLPLVTGHVEERLVGAENLSSNYLIGTFQLLKREFGCLFPFGYGVGGKVVGILLLIFLFSFYFVFQKKGGDLSKLKFYLLVGLVPIIRFLVLRNHTALHDAFTFRALMGTVLAWGLAGDQWLGDPKKDIPRDKKK
ncbi:MAG: hypothetical protein K6E84_01060 [Lachnospiraceae bacterium]|nr:hypothetical protein [Lachnospiraceae bacterium]